MSDDEWNELLPAGRDYAVAKVQHDMCQTAAQDATDMQERLQWSLLLGRRVMEFNEAATALGQARHQQLLRIQSLRVAGQVAMMGEVAGHG